MKKLLLFLSAFLMIMCSEPCTEICQNGTFCDDGECDCGEDYYGDSCEFSFYGTYTGVLICNDVDSLNHTVEFKDSDDFYSNSIINGSKYSLTITDGQQSSSLKIFYGNVCYQENGEKLSGYHEGSFSEKYINYNLYVTASDTLLCKGRLFKQ